jgi:hypothetical protein
MLSKFHYNELTPHPIIEPSGSVAAVLSKITVISAQKPKGPIHPELNLLTHEQTGSRMPMAALLLPSDFIL